MSQQGLDFSKKISKRKIFFDLTFTDVHMGRQKVPKSDFQSHFSMYSRVHKSPPPFFSKILEKLSIVQKKMIPHINGLGFSLI
mgnify:CR=1 FL=1